MASLAATTMAMRDFIADGEKVVLIIPFGQRSASVGLAGSGYTGAPLPTYSLASAMPRFLLTLALCLGWTLSASTQEPLSTSTAFPTSTAQAEDLSAEALAKLDHLVRELVAAEEVVGAELMVIKNGRSVLHESYGWRDKDDEVAMAKGSVFCVRSMTKPLIGAAIYMLIEEGKLKLEDKVGKYLPELAVGKTQAITIGQLLTHTGGFPMSLLIGTDLNTLDGIIEVANQGAGQKLEFTPGSDFRYSDHGTDTLTAVVEVVSRQTAAEFVTTRLLAPLGMHETTCVLTEDHALRARASSKYIGSKANWTRYWSAADKSMFPFFLGSQSVYSTLPDYAKFMTLYLHGGQIGGKRLLQADSVQQILTPGPHPMNGSSGLPGLKANYGSLAQLWTKANESGKVTADDVAAFGHTGSDGTHAWVFPAQNAMVLYFTQSRGTTSGLKVEEALGELFLGVPVAEKKIAPALEQHLGYYWEHDDDSYRAIVLDAGELAMEIPGKGIVALTYIGDDRWKLPDPNKVMEFNRSESGTVTGFTLDGKIEHKFTPSADLPSADEINALVQKAHRLDLLESVGPIRINASISFLAMGMSGEIITTCAYPNRFRTEAKVMAEFERVASDGETVTYASRVKPVGRIEGERAQTIRLDNNMARFGNWKDWYGEVVPIQSLTRGGKNLILVRTGDATAPARTLFIDADSGLMLGDDNVSEIEGVGRLGQRTRFSDFRNVSGMTWPYESKVRYSNRMLGTIETVVKEIEVGVEVNDDTFVVSE